MPGVLTLDIKNAEFQECFTVRGEDKSLQMSLGSLAAGEHTATVTATDVYGRTFTETLTFTVAD